MSAYWSPWPHLNVLRPELRQFSGRPHSGEAQRSPSWPPVNIWRGHDGVALTVQLAGYEPDQVEVTTNRNTLTIRGNRAATELKDGQSRLTNERQQGDFLRTFELPFDVDAERTTATFKDGVLSISLARPIEEKPKQIQIRSAN